MVVYYLASASGLIFPAMSEDRGAAAGGALPSCVGTTWGSRAAPELALAVAMLAGVLAEFHGRLDPSVVAAAVLVAMPIAARLYRPLWAAAVTAGEQKRKDFATAHRQDRPLCGRSVRVADVS